MHYLPKELCMAEGEKLPHGNNSIYIKNCMNISSSGQINESDFLLLKRKYLRQFSSVQSSCSVMSDSWSDKGIINIISLT